MTTASDVRDPWRCRLGWHRLRWFKQPDDSWKPLCSRCRRTALWWILEKESDW